jgi:anionic cell wall polymer biosynthesis LytR-Cps2A-Psr (LCP) family protein
MSVAQRVIIVAVGALAIVLGLGLIAIVRSDGAPAPQPTPTAAPVEETLLLQVLDGEGYAVGNVVMGIEPPESEPLTIMLAVPASLLVPQGDDSVTMGTTPQSADTLAGITAIEDQLGVRVDAGLTLDRLAFAGLVDAVDGVWVELDRPILLPAIGEESRFRVLGPGWVKMDGIAAADFAVQRLPGESEQQQIDRFLGVLVDAFERLPWTQDRMRQLLTSLGSLAQSTVPTEDLVPFLMSVRSDIYFGRLRVETLPVNIIRGGARPASVEAVDAEALVQSLFPDARVLVGDQG